MSKPTLFLFKWSNFILVIIKLIRRFIYVHRMKMYDEMHPIFKYKIADSFKANLKVNFLKQIK